MSVHSTSSSNHSLLHPSLSPNIIHSLNLECITSRPTSFVFTAFFIVHIFLLLPLCILILYLGFKQCRQRRSTSSATAMSHSDCFIYHMVTMELIGVFGKVLCCIHIYSRQFGLLFAGICLFSFTWFAQTSFHVLTCAERYLAVVHPITYLSLRKERGIRIRNISIGCVWLFSVGWTVLMIKTDTPSVEFCVLVLSLIFVLFCSFSVLCFLNRPGPGDRGGGKERVDQVKQRAFYTIMAILGVLLLRFAWGLVRSVLHALESDYNCVILACDIWSNLPSSLPLPLLYLHRAGKCVCCKTNIQ